ncbi:hypothetical protein HOLleu_06129 [Holothuria leucospilota]|uniref:Uncharacterized protein n=1 Tax=Holothuria leucospilota TaxID=206669 RepID=A0A9Q1HJD1_HOLLE|nr:hypothetical protein HOLleu_06129 [Holothuria leucospilota]
MGRSNISDSSGTEARSVTNVLNVSDRFLTSDEVFLLSKGIKFCPMPLNLDSIQFQRDLDAFKRRLRLFEYFHSSDENGDHTSLEIPHFRNKSVWKPPEGRDRFWIVFWKRFKMTEVDKFKSPKYIHDNLTKGERQALFSLSSDDNIIIKPEDKGPAFVVQNKASYVKSALSDLNNEKFYGKTMRICHQMSPIKSRVLSKNA